jgi:YVTN family beta-propeller protein
VTNSRSSSISVIDPTNNSVVATIATGVFPIRIAYDPFNQRLYVSYLFNGISVISGVDNLSQISTNQMEGGFAFSPNGDVYAANVNGSGISIINSSTDVITGTILIPGETANPIGIAINQDGTELFVASETQDSLLVFDLSNANVVANVSLGATPFAVTYDSLNNEVYVSLITPPFLLAAINASNFQIVTTIPTGASPGGIAIDSNNGNLYVTNTGGSPSCLGTVSVISGQTNSVTETVQVNVSPYGIAYDSTNNHLYVVDQGSDTVSEI